MNKRIILPLVSLALLIGAILLTVYFKNIEKGIERQQGGAQNKIADRQEDGANKSSEDSPEEVETANETE